MLRAKWYKILWFTYDLTRYQLEGTWRNSINAKHWSLVWYNWLEEYALKHVILGLLYEVEAGGSFLVFLWRFPNFIHSHWGFFLFYSIANKTMKISRNVFSPSICLHIHTHFQNDLAQQTMETVTWLETDVWVHMTADMIYCPGLFSFSLYFCSSTSGS